MTEQSLPSDVVATHRDVLIIGAGLSGIGAAASLVREHPERSYAVLEKKAESGGTWNLFRYPGVRSDSDMYTLGYSFKPWTQEKSLADGPSILAYVRETAAEYGVDQHTHLGREVVRAEWDTDTARWTVTARVTGGDGEPGEEVWTCDFLWVCSGYYDTEQGHLPPLPGIDDFGGITVHPQHWPEDLDWQGRRVVVIGSGATAVTLVPALANSGAAHVTMLQRTPTYILSLGGVDPIAQRLKKMFSTDRAYRVIRRKNVAQQAALYRLSRRFPRLVRKALRKGNQVMLPEGYAVDTHFNPPYDPWDQRLCLVPDGDLFKALSSGAADVVTDRIHTFTPTGIALESGAVLEADIVVTATGLNLQVFGGAEVSIDGVRAELPDAMAYRALMLSGIPNLAFTIGYTNASWTLKADLVAEFVNRLLSHMDAHGHQRVVPVRDPSVAERPLMDFEAGYVKRAAGTLPAAGDREPWLLKQNYRHDQKAIRGVDLSAEPALRFS